MQVDKDSLPMQRKDLTGYCELILDTDDYEIFEDAGYSGKNTDRPEFQRMLARIRKREFTHLLVWKIDRISRNLLDFASLYKELKDLGVTFVSKNEQFDTSTAMGEAMLKIILVFAELERNMTSERVTATMISRANSGQWNGGRVPYGYTYDPIEHVFSINEAEAESVRFMFESYGKHQSITRLSHELNDRGSRTRLGYEWTPTAVARLLKNGFYCGDYIYNMRKDGSRLKVKDQSEWVTVKDHHPAIITPEQYKLAISIMDRNQKLRLTREQLANRVKHFHVFGGILFCGKCGKMMYSTPASRRDRWEHSLYLCPTRRSSVKICDQMTISDANIGEFAFNLVLNMLNAQASFSNEMTPADLERRILCGEPFKRIAGIASDDLQRLYDLLLSGKIKGKIYGKGTEIKQPKINKANLISLKNRKEKVARAIERLQSLYLFSEDSMSEKDFILKREELNEELDEIEQQISAYETDPGDSADDEAFLKKSSEFIVAKNLTGRNYIYYKRLAQSVDPEILQSFVYQVYEKIILTDHDVQSVEFKNGISLSFTYEKSPEA